MADTQPLAPTDAEIVALADATRTAEGGANGYILPIGFARAVLAKWGAPPAVAGESGEIAQQLEYLLLETENKQHPHMGAVAFLEACEAFILDHGADILNLLSGGPTQAQAGAVPLTDEQLWANDEIMSLNADLGWHMETIRMFARAIERAHGIQGGQHGTE